MLPIKVGKTSLACSSNGLGNDRCRHVKLSVRDRHTVCLSESDSLRPDRQTTSFIDDSIEAGILLGNLRPLIVDGR